MKIQRMILTFVAAFVLSFGLVGCGKQAAQPVAIDPSVDKCEVCHMTVKDDPFATEIILTNGQALKFDDLGCLYTWTKQNGMSQVKQRFVRDYNSGQWVKLEDAWFVYDPSVVTPMAYNVVSFQNKQDAETFLKQHPNGKLLSADQLSTHNWTRNMEMMNKLKEQMKGNMNGSGNGHGSGMGN